MNRVTAATITDEQIHALGRAAAMSGQYALAMWCDYALVDDPARFDIPKGCDRRRARQHCADVLNAAADPTA